MQMRCVSPLRYSQSLPPATSSLAGTESSLQRVQGSLSRVGTLLTQASPCSATAKALASEYTSLSHTALLPEPEEETRQKAGEGEGEEPENPLGGLRGAVIPADLRSRTTAFLQQQWLVLGDPESADGADGTPAVLYDPASGWKVDMSKPQSAQIITVIAACLDQTSNYWSDRINQLQAQLQTLQQQYMMHMNLLGAVQLMAYEIAQTVAQRIA